MAYYEDLSFYNYSHFCSEEYNVGWLQKDQPCSYGTIPDGILDRLDLYLADTVHHYMGDHDCEFCDSWENASCEIRVVSKEGKVYAAPELIKHYIQVHNYLPPQEFIDAVMTGPAPGTAEYDDVIKRLPESWEHRKPDMNDSDYEVKMRKLMIDNMTQEVDQRIMQDIISQNNDFKKFVEAYNKAMPAVYNVGVKK